MGVTTFFKNCIFMLSILILLSSFLLNCVMAGVYAVGDQDEWSSQTNYATWAEKYNFTLGDVLVFKYVKGQHNVYEVREETFRSCETSSGVLAKYESGEDQVVLNKVKKYWFICNIVGHCLGGMRFGIEVKNVTNSMDGGEINQQIQPSPLENSCISQRWRVIGMFIPFGTGLLLLLLFNFIFY
ncbi:basic blue protein-like isoform X1 [Trifolium pratense]|uniref:basic blue protein-like isoform X1 n=1 Tax=Trifolium pratense TaxID=57577 RepID=UPI001E695A6B|nr:basic blue protein-like isoform X1 [Trifolium pratense]